MDMCDMRCLSVGTSQRSSEGMTAPSAIKVFIIRVTVTVTVAVTVPFFRGHYRNPDDAASALHA